MSPNVYWICRTNRVCFFNNPKQSWGIFTGLCSGWLLASSPAHSILPNFPCWPKCITNYNHAQQASNNSRTVILCTGPNVIKWKITPSLISPISSSRIFLHLQIHNKSHFLFCSFTLLFHLSLLICVLFANSPYIFYISLSLFVRCFSLGILFTFHFLPAAYIVFSSLFLSLFSLSLSCLFVYSVVFCFNI